MAFAVAWAVLGVAFLSLGNLVGIGYLALAAAWSFVARYTSRKGRPEHQPRQDNS